MKTQSHQPVDDEIVTSGTADGALLIVPVHDGLAELSRAAVLRGTARRLFETHGAHPELEEVRRDLEEQAPNPRQAQEDAGHFLRQLDALGASGGGVGHEKAGHSAGSEPTPAAASVDAQAFEGLARAVLRNGNRLRFQASGSSMRPWIPHGSFLEVEPRPYPGVRLGEVALFAADGSRLVAHRVVGRGSDGLLTRGDSSLRLDEVSEDQYLGVVTSRTSPDGDRLAVSSGVQRWFGLAAGLAYRPLAACARFLVLRPLRYSSLLRGAAGLGLRGASGTLRFVQRTSERLRCPLDVARAALLSPEEKDEVRRRLYARRAVQGFTSLEENLEAGLTLLEEVLLSRHSIQPGNTLVLGCGPGRECMELARRGFTVTGIDREEGMLSRAHNLARAEKLDIRYVTGEVVDFHLEAEPFDLIVVFSGLYNMIVPGSRRMQMLENARKHLRPGGLLLVTFLSAYVPPGRPAPPRGRTFLEALNTTHEPGDLFLLNEVVHLFPHATDLEREALAAGFLVEALYRDQRAYDRASGKVRGYAVLRNPA